jgi:hypothetical protein
VPAAEYLAHIVGLQEALGPIAQSDLISLALFAGLGFVLYRIASR